MTGVLNRQARRRWIVSLPHSAFQNHNRILGTIHAGHPIPGEEGDLGNLVMDLSPIGIPTTSQTFALRVEGESMIGAGINDGDIVILEKRRQNPGDIVAAMLEGEVTLKRYVMEAGKHLLRAANPKFNDITLDEDSVVQGVAVGLIRKL